jgi:hypothetical protein
MLRFLAPALVALALLAPAAHAADSHAPKGARLDWLPTSEWVMSSWLPYDEQRLYDALDTSRAELSTYLNDRRGLGDLARERGVTSLRALAVQLAGPNRRRQQRALDTLTQPHLANHVLFHIFHTPAIAVESRRVFGVRPATFRTLRVQGLSPAAIGKRGGRSRVAVRGTLRKLVRSRADRAVRLGAMTRTQADNLLEHQEAGLTGYVDRPFRTVAQHRAFLCRVR